MRKITTTLLFSAVLLSAALPFFLTPKVHESLSVSSNIVSALASLITLVIAVLLYSKYGVEKSVLDKQTEAVLRLLSELKKTRFIFEYKDGMLQIRLDNLRDKSWKDFKFRPIKDLEKKNLRFDIGYVEGLKNIWDIADDIFLPVEIVEKINPLSTQIIIGDKENNNTLRLQIPGYSVGFFTTEKEYKNVGILNGKEITLGEFIKLWDSVISVSTKWLETHSSIPVRLNFERK
jgi:hypothetical protein